MTIIHEMLLCYTEKMPLYIEMLQSFISDADQYGEIILGFSDSGIVPPEDMETIIDTYMSCKTDFQRMLSQLWKSYEIARALLGHTKLDSKELENYVNTVLGVIEDLKWMPKWMEHYITTSSDFLRQADYWCSQKWLGGKSELSNHVHEIENQCKDVLLRCQPELLSIHEELNCMIREYITPIS